MPFITKVSVFFSVALVSLVVVFCVVLLQWAGGIAKAPSSGHNLKGSTNGTDFTDYSSSSRQTSAICLITMVEVEKNDTDLSLGYADDEGDDEILICNRVSGQYDSGISDSLLYVTNVDRKAILENQKAMLNNEWFIEYSHDWVQDDQSQVGTIRVPDDHIINTIDPTNVPRHTSIEPHHRRTLSFSLDERRRKLQDTLGPRTVVVVAVGYYGDLAVLYDHVFGVNESLVSQMDDCSQSQVTIHPHPVHPIIQVFPPGDSGDYTFVELYSAILDNIKMQLGLRPGQAVTSTTDHLLLVVPDQINRRPGELGWGATPGFFSGIIHSLAPSTMTMMHEIGHNFGLGHAYEDHVAYSDMSTVMGYSHRNVVKMCYNGQNMWDMGWFKDRRTSVQLEDDRDIQIVNVAFYGDYLKTRNNQPVVVRYNELFLTYNRQIGMNIETKEYANMLLVVQELPGEYHSHTNLETALDVNSGTYKMQFDDDDEVFIEVCSHTLGTSISPDMLTVAMGKKKNNLCPNVSRQQNNRGVVQAPLECKMMWPWVEIMDPDNSNARNIVLCESVADDRDQYCGELDSRSEDFVWKICRLECPQSGCIEEEKEAIVPAAEDTGCEDLSSWVEVEYGTGNYISKTCGDIGIGFAQDTYFFCNAIDTLTGLRVDEVCRINCPTSGCSD